VTVSVVGGVLTAQCDSGSNTVTVDHGITIDFGGYATINGQSFFDSQYNSIRINGGAGGTLSNIHGNVKSLLVNDHSNHDVVNVGDTSNRVQGIQGMVSVQNVGSFNTDVINVNNQGDSAFRTATVDTRYIGLVFQEKLTGLGAAEMDFSTEGTHAANIRTGSGGTALGVLSTPPLDSGNGGTTIIGGATNGAVDTFNVGNAGSIQQILGRLTIQNTNLNVDDSADTAQRPNVVLGQSSLTGLASPAPINYPALLSLTVRAGASASAPNHITVTGTPRTGALYGGVLLTTAGGVNTIDVQRVTAPFFEPPLLLLGGPLAIRSSGSDTVNVGNNGSVQDIGSSLTIQNPPSYTALNIDDSADNARRDAVLSPSSITGLAPAPINYTQSDLRSLNVRLGNSPSGGNYLNITDTPISGVAGGLMTTVTTGIASNGNDDVIVAATTGALTVNLRNDGLHPASSVQLGGVARTLDHILTPVTVNTSSGWTDLGLYDDQTAASQTYTVTAHSVSRSGRLMATYNITNELFLYASRGANTINVQGTSQATVINGGWSDDTVNVGNAANTLNDLDGGAGSYLSFQINNPGSRIIFNDQGSTTSRIYTLTTDARGPIPAISVSGVRNEFVFTGPLAALIFNGGSGSDIYNIETTFTDTTVNAGTGGNIFRVSPVAQYLGNLAGPLTVNGGGSDILEFFDTNNPASETYTFDSVPSTLSLATVPVTVNFSGMSAVYLMTNGMSTVNDPSGTIIVDPVGGPP
jgi:hypothetical protein